MTPPPPISPEDFAAILGPKGGSTTATATTDWSTAFEATSFAASSSSAQQHLRPDTRRPIDVANAMAASEATFHAFANDGAQVLGFLDAHLGPLDLDDDGILEHAWHPHDQHSTAMLPHMQDGWHIMEPPTHSVHAREHWDHWAREFLATMPPTGIAPDGAAVTAYARNQVGGVDYIQDVWDDTAIQAWDQALRAGTELHGKRHYGLSDDQQGGPGVELEQAVGGDGEPVKAEGHISVPQFNRDPHATAVDRIRSIIGHLRYVAPPDLSDSSTLGRKDSL